ncbi:hypothetical protein [Streptomyces sp. NPDC001020]
MNERRLMSGLMTAAAEGKEEYAARPDFPGMKKFAAFAYVADKFGYQYVGHVPGSAAMNNPYFLFRRTPEAQERAAAGMPGCPDAARDDMLPGMVPGRGLTPDPSAQPEVDLLYSRMIVDACGRYNPRVLTNILILAAVMAVFLAFPGYTVGRVLIAAAIWGAFFALYLVGLGVTHHRRKRHLAHLAAAGVEWPSPTHG